MEPLNFINSNVFQPDGDITEYERQPHFTVSIRCPHCSHVGAFQPTTRGVTYSKSVPGVSQSRSSGIAAFMRNCPNPKCRGLVLTLTLANGKICTFPPEQIDFNANGLPANLLATLKEAIACHAAGAYRASAMMVRRLLEEICDESGAQGKDLHARLIALKAKITLPEELFDAMGELKALGNDAAHIAAKNYTYIGKDEGEDCLELAKEILKARYQLKGLVDRLRARRGQPNP